MTIQQLVTDYKHIGQLLDQKWPIKDQNKRIFARTLKVLEEFGELSDEILTSMNLQRQTKIDQFTHEHLQDEFADVMGSLILLASELDIDVEAVMKRKIDFTKKRMEEMENS
jgi:NTP pyrophosphatase (non-canonical NTP hydrolase)